MYNGEREVFSHPNTFADDNQPLQVMISPEDTKETNAMIQECSGRDGEASQRSHASGNGDVNRNETEKNVFPPSGLEISGKGELKGSDKFEKYSKTPNGDAENYSLPPPEDPDQDVEIEENGKCSFAFILTHTEQ